MNCFKLDGMKFQIWKQGSMKIPVLKGSVLELDFWAGSVTNIDLGPALQNVEKEWMIRQNSSRSARARI